MYPNVGKLMVNISYMDTMGFAFLVLLLFLSFCGQTVRVLVTKRVSESQNALDLDAVSPKKQAATREFAWFTKNNFTQMSRIGFVFP